MTLLCALSVVPVNLYSATLNEGQYDVEISFQKPKDPQEEQKIIRFDVEQKSVSPIRLYYSRDVDFEKISEADFIQIEFQDLSSLKIVEKDVTQPLLAAAVVTDGGAILSGYVVAEESFLKADLRMAEIFRSIEHIEVVTHQEDVKDSVSYPFEYSKEYLWGGVQEGDYVIYEISEDRPYREVIKVTKVHESSVDLEVIKSGQKEPQKVSIDWKIYPKINIKSFLSIKTIKLDSIFVHHLAEKKKLSVEVFEFEGTAANEKTFVFSLMPSLFPLTVVQECNGVVQIRDENEKIIRKITEVSRLRVDEGKKALDTLSLEEKEALRAEAKNDSTKFLSILQKEHLHANTIDQFVAIDELFIQLDGFPLAFSETKTVQEKIQEMEAQVDQHFDQLENDLRLCQSKISQIENLLKNNLTQQEHMTLTQNLLQWKQRLQMLNRLGETSREEVKRKKRQRYLDSVHQESLSRRNVIANELSHFFRKVVPSNMTADALLQFGRFRLISPDRAILSFPKNKVLIHLKRYDSTWKVCALIH
ncbi:MAG: hypothetical protein HYW47_01795 [Deltaproteobacteria bacterium]|nr:hypothetical protein [Deltaproteobacteria bacterium]